MRVIRAAAAVAVAAGIILAVPATAHADETRTRQWYLTTLRLAEAHKEATGEGVTIGLVDSGTDPAHQDLEGAIEGGQNFGEDLPDNGKGGTGTADAAILAGRGHGENAGVLGVAPGATIVPAEISATGPQQGPAIVEAIEFLIKQDVDIIAVGLTTPDDEKLRVVTQQAAKKGIPVVASAGNDSTGAAGYPVGSKGTVNVVGSDKEGAAVPSDVPVPGADEAVTVAAPSQDLPMAGTGEEYTTGSSPSFAVAIVAGTMALVKERQPDLAGEDLIGVLKDSADGKGEYDEQLGYGVVNPGQAIKAEADGSDATGSGSLTGGGNTTLAMIISVIGVLALAALVVVVRSRDARIRRLALAGPAGLSTNTGTMPRITDTGNMPRIADTGTFPRVSDAPPGTAPHGHTPPYGQNRPGR